MRNQLERDEASSARCSIWQLLRIGSRAMPALASIAVAVAQIVILASAGSVMEGMVITLRVYCLIFAIFSLVLTFEVKLVFTWLPVFKPWIGRAFLFVFVGVLSAGPALPTAQSGSETQQHVLEVVDVVRRVTGWTLICIGIVYGVLGALCVDRILEKRTGTSSSSSAAVAESEEIIPGGYSAVSTVGEHETIAAVQQQQERNQRRVETPPNPFQPSGRRIAPTASSADEPDDAYDEENPFLKDYIRS